MGTEKTTQYDTDEQAFIQAAQKLQDNYNVNVSDLIDILKDNLEEDTE